MTASTDVSKFQVDLATSAALLSKRVIEQNQIDIDKETLLAKLQNLRKCAEDNDDDRAVELLADIVPTFDHKLNK